MVEEQYEDWNGEEVLDDAVYSSHGRQMLVEDDEISAYEEAFMEGYEGAEA